MKHCNQCLNTKPTSDFYKNRVKSDGLSDQCKACCKQCSAKRRADTPELTREAVRRARESNKAVYNERRRGEAGILRRSKNIDALKKSFRRYRQENKPKLAAYRAKRRASQANATPMWADMSAIEVMYVQAREGSMLTGIMLEVDHIVPLANPLVCGLHCEDNLQIITRYENRKKSNKVWPNMP